MIGNATFTHIIVSNETRFFWITVVLQINDREGHRETWKSRLWKNSIRDWSSAAQGSWELPDTTQKQRSLLHSATQRNATDTSTFKPKDQEQ